MVSGVSLPFCGGTVMILWPLASTAPVSRVTMWPDVAAITAS